MSENVNDMKLEQLRGEPSAGKPAESLGDRMGSIAEAEAEIGKGLDLLKNSGQCDARCLSIARTKFEEAFMYLRRAQFRKT